MNTVFHVIVGLAAVIFFFWRYTQTKYAYHIILSVWMLSTFLVYLSGSLQFRMVLAGCECVMFVLFLASYLASGKKRRAEARYCEKLRKKLEQQD